MSTYPALEGRFPQVSNISFSFDPKLPPNSRIPDPTNNIKIGKEPLNMDKKYIVVTRGYMGRGKDGFDSLLVQSEGGEAEEIVSEENGILISMMLRQYFMSLKILGQWSKWGRSMDRHWKGVHDELHESHPVVEPRPGSREAEDGATLTQTLSAFPRPQRDEHGFLDDSDDEHHVAEPHGHRAAIEPRERQLALIRRVTRKWRRLAGLSGHSESCDSMKEEEFQADWTRVRF